MLKRVSLSGNHGVGHCEGLTFKSGTKGRRVEECMESVPSTLGVARTVSTRVEPTDANHRKYYLAVHVKASGTCKYTPPPLYIPQLPILIYSLNVFAIGSRPLAGFLLGMLQRATSQRTTARHNFKSITYVGG